jgi:hypothetical protein
MQGAVEFPRPSQSRSEGTGVVDAETSSGTYAPFASYWLTQFFDNPKTDWGTQKSAHQAVKFLELAQYEMWNMQWWDNSRQVKLHEEAEKNTV